MSEEFERLHNIVKRTTLIVRDIQRSRRWYEYVMGMSVYYDSEFVLSGVGLAAGKAGDKTHLMILKCDDPEIGMIGLLQWVDPVMPAPPIEYKVGYGNPTFVVSSGDAVETHRRAIEMETKVHANPHDWSTRGANGKMKHFVGLSLFDPDGYFFELNQLVKETDD
jgi:catechol 2,3-dioxygenase-like lactoylglutathione lyase family enzyme